MPATMPPGDWYGYAFHVREFVDSGVVCMNHKGVGATIDRYRLLVFSIYWRDNTVLIGKEKNP